MGLCSLMSCRWREGREVWIERFEAGPGDAQVDCGTREDPCLISAQALWVEIESETSALLILDLRPLESCQASRIPGAQCNPYIEGALSEPVDCDGGERLVLYDSNGAIAPEVAWDLPEACEPRISLLEDGWGAWTIDCADCPIEDDALSEDEG